MAFEKLKGDIKDHAKTTVQKLLISMDHEINELTAKKNAIAADPSIPTAHKCVDCAVLQEQISAAKRRKHMKARDGLAALYCLESECATSKIWAKSG